MFGEYVVDCNPCGTHELKRKKYKKHGKEQDKQGFQTNINKANKLHVAY
jgi:hypothetical protein